ncbi:Conserved protein of uncharacterised function, PPE family protein [Mycobacteroides abscessus subsp. abscessus]|nr:hypothetical protein [Mycobacteroides abscessus]SHQ13657.1 Conserved protein of uncharacterised function, PPE family protein [Mycobacteroides abscessus subsp. abscessus]SHT30756.1 Conserved protein of uncharacterised function, PPE family protein [Mycobacteroides abscessus subsp. abscessus]SHU79558.1 Conserved protein of uncharacterised function, PPE family protein [Mycobacteroides abscessus subsp. abscessus]SHU83104.1 Conserved protein of uncharacterised function, PPE family protein [Mycobac
MQSYHDTVWEFLVLLLIGGSLALLIMQMRRGRQAQPGMNAVQGTLLVTGVSPRPEGVTGEQLVTITGALNGPTVAEYITYRQIVRDVNDWPRIGDLIPVLYPPKNPDRWNILLAPLPGPTPPPMENIDPSPPPPPPPPPPPGPVEGPPSTGDPAKKHEPPPRYYEPPPL